MVQLTVCFAYNLPVWYSNHAWNSSRKISGLCSSKANDKNFCDENDLHHNKLIKSQSSHKATHFRGQLFSATWYFSFLWLSLWRIAYGSSFVFVQSKRRLLHKHFARKKCFCYVIQRQTTFSPHNNPPSQRNCKLLCHNSNWAIIPDPTMIEHGCETDTKWTWLLSWKHLIDVHQNLVFQMGKNHRGACVTGNRCKEIREKFIYL